jgi:hypothetical protein
LKMVLKQSKALPRLHIPNDYIVGDLLLLYTRW